MPDNSIGKNVLHLQSADVCVIIDIGGLRRDNITDITMPQPPQSRPTGTIGVASTSCHAVPGVARRARLEVPENSIDKSVLHLQSADVCVIIDIGGLRRDNLTGIPTPQPPQSRPTGPA